MQDAYPIIAWDNLIANATVGATDESGGSAQNVKDWRPYVRWGTANGAGAQGIGCDLGAPMAVSCLALCGHNFKTANITDLMLYYSDDDVNWFPILGPLAPDSDSAKFYSFAPATHQYWALEMTVGAIGAQLGVWFLGNYVRFAEYPLPGFDPDHIKPVTEQNISGMGNLLGVVRKFTDRTIACDMGQLERAWVETNLFPLEKIHHPKPFFWVWDETNHPDDVYLVRFTDSEFKHEIQDNLRQVNLQMEGVMEE